jgi:hypothetical protein
MDLKLDISHDCVWENGPLTDIGVTHPLTETVGQRLLILLRSFKGDWFYNTTYGVPYFQSILGKKTTKANVDLIFQTAILSEPGVKQIVTFNSSLVNRQYSLTFSVKVVDGTITQPITITPV